MAGRHKKIKNTVKALMTGAVLVILVAAIVITVTNHHSKKNKKVDPEGIQKLKDMEKKDIYAIEDEISSVQAGLHPTEPASETAESTEEETTFRNPLEDGFDVRQYNYKNVYANTLIMGDSIAEPIRYYQILDATSVVAEVGTEMFQADEQIEKARQISPQNIILYFGLNDIARIGNDFQRYHDEYKGLITKVQEAVPNAKIYANLLMRNIDPIAAGGPEYADLTPYNDVIRQVCEEMDVPCFDCSEIVRDEFFEPDGYHFKYQFYFYWLYAMAVRAGLI